MRWVEIRNLVFPRDHANILFQHEMRKCFEELINLMVLTWQRAYLIWDLENSRYHYTQFRQLKGAFLYIF